jgi:DNA-binding transcriptional MerR regulator
VIQIDERRARLCGTALPHDHESLTRLEPDAVSGPTVEIMDESRWSVGEPAAATGLSVRVLRHWDALGVVAPTRTPNGHRRYGPDEIVRLHQALALRRTGLPLERIADLLADRTPARPTRSALTCAGSTRSSSTADASVTASRRLWPTSATTAPSARRTSS